MKRFHTNQNHHRDRDRNNIEPRAAGHTDGRCNPKTGCRSQAVDHVLLENDDAAPDKADTRNDLRSNTRRVE